MKDLNPCPLCGGEAEIWIEFESYSDNCGNYDERKIYNCGCRKCEMFVSVACDKNATIMLWNELCLKVFEHLKGELKEREEA